MSGEGTRTWATAGDWARRTGQPVPTGDDAARIQQLLDDAAALLALHMPAGCLARADAGDEALLAILAALTCARVTRLENAPPGIASESVGSVSVTYAGGLRAGTASDASALTPSEKATLARACGHGGGLIMAGIINGGGTRRDGPATAAPLPPCRGCS